MNECVLGASQYKNEWIYDEVIDTFKNEVTIAALQCDVSHIIVSYSLMYAVFYMVQIKSVNF